MKPVFYRYELWECHKMRMYHPQVTPQGVTCSYDLLRDLERLYRAMDYVANHWKYSATMNLSNRSRNRQAYLGQAACCWLVHSTEDETKIAWRRLTAEEQKLANDVADRVIEEWEASYAEA